MVVDRLVPGEYINDLFLDTGLTNRLYSFIQQGQIGEITLSGTDVAPVPLPASGLLLLAGLLLAPVAALIALAALVFGLRHGLDAVEGTVKPWIRSLWGG